MDYASIITAVGGVLGVVSTIVVAWFGYNQFTKNKMTELKIKKIEEQDKEELKRRSDISMVIFGELWNLLYETGADRVYIVQPHPLGDEEMLTIYFEVKHKGIEPMRPHIQELKIREVDAFSEQLAKEEFMYLMDLEEQVSDRYAQSIFATYGCKHALVRRLANTKYKWTGSIFCEYMDDMNIDRETAKQALSHAATNIQYILPEFRN